MSDTFPRLWSIAFIFFCSLISIELQSLFSKYRWQQLLAMLMLSIKQFTPDIIHFCFTEFGINITSKSSTFFQIKIGGLNEGFFSWYWVQGPTPKYPRNWTLPPSDLIFHTKERYNLKTHNVRDPWRNPDPTTTIGCDFEVQSASWRPLSTLHPCSVWSYYFESNTICTLVSNMRSRFIRYFG